MVITGPTDVLRISPLDHDNNKKLFVMAPKVSKKAQNIRRKSKIYISIADESFPYKDVKGKG